jgi:hypothetical protein
MTEFFDFIYHDQRVMAPLDTRRGFFSEDVGSLDAPKFIPAGSTEARSDFHTTSFTFRHGG